MTAVEAPQRFSSSPAGPLRPGEEAGLKVVPKVTLPVPVTTMRFGVRPESFTIAAQRKYGDTFAFNMVGLESTLVSVNHPDHVKSLFVANPVLAPSITPKSPLRPILGPSSVLTSLGETHMRQRKLLLPAFHGDSVQRYVAIIESLIDDEIDRWPVGKPFAIAPRMQAVTLDVIMAGVFGISPTPDPTSVEFGLRQAIRRLLGLTANPLWNLIDLMHLGREEPRGPLKPMLKHLDGHFYKVIHARRTGASASTDGLDILTLLLAAKDEAGEPLTDGELRDQLLTLVLAGHETTANSLAWALERLTRTPAAYDALRDATRSGGNGDAYVDATVHEAMRVRPVIPSIGRAVQVPWQFGEYVVPAGTVVMINIRALHNRADVYPDPGVFRPERFLGVKPGTYTWIPLGGGIRRCLGAALAMAEQRVVLRAIARRTDMIAPDAAAERAVQRNVTSIPQRGGRVVITKRYA